MTLPVAAGLAYLNQLTKDDFRKSHHLSYVSDEPSLLPWRPGIGGGPLPGQENKPLNSFLSTARYSAVEQWPDVHGTPLQFGSYVYEDFALGRIDEKISVRRFLIYFHLDDNTVKIMEEHPEHADVIQPGRFLCRQRVPKADNPEEYLTVHEFNVGKAVMIYGRQHMIYKCDAFTRNVLTRVGFEVPEDVTPPFAQFTASASTKKGMTETLHRHINTDCHFADFLKDDRNVLRFFAVWDDTGSMFGDRHLLVIHYYLSDHTMEVLQTVPQFIGRHKLLPLVKRGKIPKRVEDLAKLFPGAPWTVLKTMPNAKMPAKDYFLFDQAALPDVAESISDKDLDCGRTITVFNRKLLLYDCDDFTRWYYKRTYGKDLHSINVLPVPKPPPARVILPYNDYGSEEDSIVNCLLMLMPKPLTIDARKYLLLDSDPDDPTLMTFKMKMLSENTDDSDRSFILTYNFNDDSVFINEKHSPEGNLQGSYLQKKSVKNGVCNMCNNFV